MQDLITEFCPHCETEITLAWNVEEDGYQIYCPNCGKIIMLCSMCDGTDGGVCDWTENGCKHSDKRYAKTNNDGCMYQTYGIAYQYDGHFSGDVQGVNARCIAWQPLPEPYKAERRDAVERESNNL